MKNEITTLLEHLYKYYPIGAPNQQNSYDGILRKNKIVEQKITDIIEKKDTKWTVFLGGLEKAKIGFPINDVSYLQFPSYEMSIVIKDIVKENICEIKRELVINASLLCPVFTIFYRDTYKFLFNESIPLHHIVYLQAGRLQDDLIKQIKKTFEASFSDYDYYDHYLLFKYKIYGYDPSGYSNLSVGVPIYNFLFDESFDIRNVDVLK
ncbi:hypothetical protein [Niabella beijingensis]|uniref:hypothetical protein n=1 Tax=Niabella beijingensis TaxID=2872700 RepID=UPI001CBE0F14|nr:hypothetical protein [Niabella beijingensis]MBZ4192658.1 hypothetical protein [Niabella beijingensis]